MGANIENTEETKDFTQRGVESGALGAHSGGIDADLRAIVDAWPGRRNMAGNATLASTWTDNTGKAALTALILIGPNCSACKPKLVEALDRAATESNQPVLRLLEPRKGAMPREQGMKASEIEHRRKLRQLLDQGLSRDSEAIVQHSTNHGISTARTQKQSIENLRASVTTYFK